MKWMCSVLTMVLLAGRLDLCAQTLPPRGTQSSVAHAEASLHLVDADTLARIRKALHATHSDQWLSAIPAQYFELTNSRSSRMRAQSMGSRNGTVADETAWGAAIGTSAVAIMLFFACHGAIEPDPDCNKATIARYVGVGAGIGALGGLVIGILRER